MTVSNFIWKTIIQFGIECNDECFPRIEILLGPDIWKAIGGQDGWRKLNSEMLWVFNNLGIELKPLQLKQMEVFRKELARRAKAERARLL